MKEVYKKFEEEGGKKMIYQLDRYRDGDSEDMKGEVVEVVILDGGGRLLTESGAVLKVSKGYFKELLNWGGSNGNLQLLCYIEGKVELVEIIEEEVWTALKRMKK